MTDKEPETIEDYAEILDAVGNLVCRQPFSADQVLSGVEALVEAYREMTSILLDAHRKLDEARIPKFHANHQQMTIAERLTLAHPVVRTQEVETEVSKLRKDLTQIDYDLVLGHREPKEVRERIAAITAILVSLDKELDRLHALKPTK